MKEFEVGLWWRVLVSEAPWVKKNTTKKAGGVRISCIFSIFSVWSTFQPGSRAVLCSQSPIGWFVSPNHSGDDGSGCNSLLGMTACRSFYCFLSGQEAACSRDKVADWLSHISKNILIKNLSRAHDCCSPEINAKTASVLPLCLNSSTPKNEHPPQINIFQRIFKDIFYT